MILQGSPFGHEAPLVHGCASEHVTTHTPAWHVPTPAQPCSHFNGSGGGGALLPSSTPPAPLPGAFAPGSPPWGGSSDGPLPPTLAGVGMGMAMGTTAGV